MLVEKLFAQESVHLNVVVDLLVYVGRYIHILLHRAFMRELIGASFVGITFSRILFFNVNIIIIEASAHSELQPRCGLNVEIEHRPNHRFRLYIAVFVNVPPQIATRNRPIPIAVSGIGQSSVRTFI